MKALKSVVFVALSSLLAAACTVTVSEGDDAFDDDDLMIDDQQPFDGGALNPATQPTQTQDTDPTDPTDTDEPSSGDDTADAGDDSDVPDASTDDGEVPDASTDDTSEPDASTDDTDVPTDTEVEAGMCELPESAPPSCEACLSEECSPEYSACFCDEDCSVQLATLRSCYSELNSPENPSLDPAADWEACYGQAVGDAEQDLLINVLSCTGDAYDAPDAGAAEDPYNRASGDGQCSFACFSLYNFDEL